MEKLKPRNGTIWHREAAAEPAHLSLIHSKAHLPLERSDKTQGVLSAVCLKEGFPLSSVHRVTP